MYFNEELIFKTGGRSNYRIPKLIQNNETYDNEIEFDKDTEKSSNKFFLYCLALNL